MDKYKLPTFCLFKVSVFDIRAPTLVRTKTRYKQKGMKRILTLKSCMKSMQQENRGEKICQIIYF